VVAVGVAPDHAGVDAPAAVVCCGARGRHPRGAARERLPAAAFAAPCLRVACVHALPAQGRKRAVKGLRLHQLNIVPKNVPASLWDQGRLHGKLRASCVPDPTCWKIRALLNIHGFNCKFDM